MFAAKSLTMEERGVEDGFAGALALVARRGANDQMCQLAPFVAGGRFILFKFVWTRGGYRTSPRMSLIASMLGRAMARAFSAPSAKTLFV
jgi:hypothetical protein